MSMEIDTASSCTDLLDRLDAFLKKGHTLTPQYTGTGNGLMTGAIGTSSSVQETITVTFSSSTAFAVSGSVTGSMGTGTVGTLFTHAKVNFTITAGGTAWVNGDTIAMVMTIPWTQKRGTSGDQYIWSAPDNDGLGAIYVGCKRFFDTGSGNYDNLRLGGFTGYDGPSSFEGQPGFVGVPGPVLPLWNTSIPYWFMATGRRVIIIAKVSTNYESAYLGFITAYASPGQFPYPLIMGAPMGFYSEPGSTSPNWRFSYSGAEHRAFPMPNAPGGPSNNQSQLRLRKPDGTWLGFAASYVYYNPGAVWPYSIPGSQMMTDLRPNLDGSYPLFPCVLTEGAGQDITTGLPTTTNVFGEFDGVRATTGHNNGSENTITVGRESWLVVQNIAATTKHDYFAVRMD